MSNEISDTVIAGVITSVKCLQIPSFSYNKDHAETLEKLGFMPTDSVYELIIKFKGGSKKHVANIIELYDIAKHYNTKCPNELKGNEVRCTLTAPLIPDGLIARIEPPVTSEPAYQI